MKINYLVKIPKYLRTTLTGLGRFKKIFRKIPTLVWGLLACTTIFVGGMLIGYLRGMQAENPGTPNYTLKEENKKLKDLVSGYNELSKVYFEQGQEMSIILDQNMVENHPEEIRDALQGMDQKRDLINLHLGRILELRRIAGLAEFSSYYSNIR